jgi:hypothetical protein
LTRLFSPEDPAFARIIEQIADARGIGISHSSHEPLLPERLAVLIETAFWASIRANEGRITRVRAAVASPGSVADAVSFVVPAAYNESQIEKLAHAVPPGGCLLVSDSLGGLNIWGVGRGRPDAALDSLMLEISGPGIVRVNIGPIRPFIVFSGPSVLAIEGVGTNLAAYLLRALKRRLPSRARDLIENQAAWQEILAFGALARTIVDDGHGGIILIVPGENGGWMASLDPFPYRFELPETTIRDSIRLKLKDFDNQEKMIERSNATDVPEELKTMIMSRLGQRPWEFQALVRPVASLAGVDGAIVMTRDLRVLGFGATIAVKGSAPEVSLFSPELVRHAVVRSPLETVGGTRHQASARFVHANRETVALVISQDRHMSVMRWDESINSVAVVRNAEWWT